MNIEEYIHSGILELYVYGALTQEESAKVTLILNQYPQVKEEVEEIEAVLLNLSAAAAPNNPAFLINSIKSKLSNTATSKPLRRPSNLPAYIGWAASILLLLGLFFMFNKNRELRESLQAAQAQKAQIENQIIQLRTANENAEELLGILRDKNIIRVPLTGQQAAPTAFAAAYWDPNTQITYIDAKDLPSPPQGMVYQVWSLKLEPLTPTSIGLLDNFDQEENLIFKLPNTNASEAFGITLEPAGGSDSPNMEQLYTLGVVST